MRAKTLLDRRDDSAKEGVSAFCSSLVYASAIRRMSRCVSLSTLRPGGRPTVGVHVRAQVSFLRLKSALKKSGSSGSAESSPTASLIKVQSPRHEAAQALAWVLHCNQEARQVPPCGPAARAHAPGVNPCCPTWTHVHRRSGGAVQARQESGSSASPSGSPAAGEGPLRAVLICCEDCALPVEAVLGEAAGDVLVIR